MPSPCGVEGEIDTGNDSLISEIVENTKARHTHGNKPVLDKLAEDNKGRLTYGGKAIVDEVIDSLAKWDGGAY